MCIHCSVVKSVVGCRLGMVSFAPHLYHTIVCVVRVWLGCGTTLIAIVWCRCGCIYTAPRSLFPFEETLEPHW